MNATAILFEVTTERATYHKIINSNIVNCDKGIVLNKTEDSYVEGTRIGNCNWGIEWIINWGFGILDKSWVVDCNNVGLSVAASQFVIKDSVFASNKTGYTHIKLYQNTKLMKITDSWFESIGTVLDLNGFNLEQLDLDGVYILSGAGNKAIKISNGTLNQVRLKTISFSSSDGTEVDLFENHPNMVLAENIKIYSPALWRYRGYKNKVNFLEDSSGIHSFGTFKITGMNVEIGTNGIYGNGTTITTPSGLISYPRIKITWNGVFGSNEMVTVKIESVYTDGSTASIEKSQTQVGILWLTDYDILALLDSEKDIIKFNIYAKTNTSSTFVNVTIDAYGIG